MPADRSLVVRAPASSANLGAGFDVFGMALSLHCDVGSGPPPDGAHPIDDAHPARLAFEALGGRGPFWMRSNIPMARGLGFSGALRVAAAALAAATRRDDPAMALAAGSGDVLRVAAELEGHGDNAAASLQGGVVAYVDGRAVPLPLGPVLGSASVVAWIPDVTTSTDTSRRSLPAAVDRADAVHNLGHAVQFALAFARDDPELLARATSDRLHQDHRVPHVPGAGAALDAGAAAGAWCGWLSGSGPTVAFLVDPDHTNAVADAVAAGGHTKTLAIDTAGCHIVEG